MMRALALLLSLALSISQASAGQLLNSQRFGVGVTFRGCAIDNTDLTTYTFSSFSVGAAGNRDTIVLVLAIDTVSAYNTSSVTVGGDSATEVVDEAGSGLPSSSLHIVDNPAGTSEDIVVTMSEAINVMRICVWAAYDLSSETAVAATADDDTAAGALILDLSSTTSAGIAIGGCLAESGGTDAVWTGLDQAYDDGFESAAHLAPTLGGALTVRCDWGDSNDVSGVAASFR